MTLPPGPRTPHFIQALQFRARPLAYLDACAQRYGDIFTAGGNGASPSVYVSSPSVVQEMLGADHALFEAFRGDWAARFLFGAGSMVFREGEGHQRERRLLTPPFHGERLRAGADTITEITREVVEVWRTGEPFFVGPAMREITLRVIFRMVFGADAGERLQRLRHLFSSLMTSLNSPWSLALLRSLAKIPVPLWRWRSLLATKDEIDRLIYEEIRERRERSRSASGDVLALLMSADNGAGLPPTDQEVHDEIMTLLFAGHETTASSIAWALYRLHRSPDAHDKLRRELDTLAVGTDAMEISRLPYLAAVCQETLRLNPPCMSVLRVLKAPLALARYRFAPGTTLIISIYLTHRRADLYPHTRALRAGTVPGAQVFAVRVSAVRWRAPGLLGEVAGAVRNEAGACDDSVALAACAGRSSCGETWTPHAHRGSRGKHALDPRSRAGPARESRFFCSGAHTVARGLEQETRACSHPNHRHSSASSCRPAIGVTALRRRFRRCS